MPFAAKHLVKVNVPITFRLETIGNFDFNYGNFSIYIFFSVSIGCISCLHTKKGKDMFLMEKETPLCDSYFGLFTSFGPIEKCMNNYFSPETR